MANIRKSMIDVQALLHQFDDQLSRASSKSSSPVASSAPLQPRAKSLREQTAFGSNPGNLRMMVHAPKQASEPPALVVALHGCGQSAAEYARGSGWSTLADRYGFYVVYPEQQPSNNPNTCFTWFLPGDTARGQGEASSIHEMVEHAVAKFGVDRKKVFVTGLSAGGAMTSVMLATYPEVFSAGAIIAGLPYGSAENVQQAFEAMFTEQSPSERVLGDRVRQASRHSGPWPRVSVWHGTADMTVKWSNAELVVRQWADVHGLADIESAREDLLDGHTRRVWNDASGNTLIEAFIIAGMAHGVPIAASMGAQRCGAPGPFFLDVGISSTHRIASMWGLDKGVAFEDTADATDVTELHGSQANATDAATPASIWLHDHGQVIAAAFKAAGLPAPGSADAGQPGTTGKVSPASIIEAALKAAGLGKK